MPIVNLLVVAEINKKIYLQLFVLRFLKIVSRITKDGVCDNNTCIAETKTMIIEIIMCHPPPRSSIFLNYHAYKQTPEVKDKEVEEVDPEEEEREPEEEEEFLDIINVHWGKKHQQFFFSRLESYCLALCFTETNGNEGFL